MKKFEVVLLAIAIAIAAPVGTALLTLNDGTFTDPWPWVRALLIGCAVALGALAYKWSQAHGPVITIAPRTATPTLVPAAEFTTNATAVTYGSNPIAGVEGPYPVELRPAPAVPLATAAESTLPDHTGTLPRPEAVSPTSASPTS